MQQSLKQKWLHQHEEKIHTKGVLRGCAGEGPLLSIFRPLSIMQAFWYVWVVWYQHWNNPLQLSMFMCLPIAHYRGPVPLLAFLTSLIRGLTLDLTLWCLMHHLLHFLRRKVIFHGKQTSQEASAHWPTHNKVDLKPVHIWVGWLN